MNNVYKPNKPLPMVNCNVMDSLIQKQIFLVLSPFIVRKQNSFFDIEINFVYIFKLHAARASLLVTTITKIKLVCSITIVLIFTWQILIHIHIHNERTSSNAAWQCLTVWIKECACNVNWGKAHSFLGSRSIYRSPCTCAHGQYVAHIAGSPACESHHMQWSTIIFIQIHIILYICLYSTPSIQLSKAYIVLTRRPRKENRHLPGIVKPPTTIILSFTPLAPPPRGDQLWMEKTPTFLKTVLHFQKTIAPSAVDPFSLLRVRPPRRLESSVQRN
jgi:hypothetical protein